MLLTTLALGFRAPVPLGRSAPHRRAFLDVRLCATPLALEEQLLQPELSAQEVSELISALAASPGAATEPALSPLIEGEWVLVHTSKSTFDVRNPLGRRADGSTPGLEGAFAALSGGAKVSAPSSSPIQRALTEAFSVTQLITLQGPDKRVLQCVETPLGTLRLGANLRPRGGHAAAGAGQGGRAPTAVLRPPGAPRRALEQPIQGALV